MGFARQTFKKKLMKTIQNLPKIDKKDFPLLENNSQSKNTIFYLL